MKKFYYVIVLLILFQSEIYSKEFIYILKDKCLNTIYTEAFNYFSNSEIKIYKDIRGVILSFKLNDLQAEYYSLTTETLKNIKQIENFLAKIENPAIIEVHTSDNVSNNVNSLKKWEISTVIANKIETQILNLGGKDISQRIKSVGYGEFLPTNNTPNNGSKKFDRVDIIVLCNISGE
ncbi:MAG: hypothetical protein E7Z89_04315 [Cyanobacteria bacterium SIG28]|nr:hypothetical protein [Cyanobacteria bacterium SIG28]